MFDHENFEVYDFENVPLDEDSYLMDECYMDEYELAMLNSFSTDEYTNVGYIGWIEARRITKNSMELSWYPDLLTTLHEVTVSLPKDQFVKCVGCSAYSKRPHIFVKSSWLEHLYLRQYSIFCIVDAIGVIKALHDGELSHDKLIELRNAIDEVAEHYPKVSFISFADSLLLKSNWSVGTFRSETSYTYEPEIFIQLVKDIRKIYNDILGLDIYAIITQGSNEYYEDSLLHISESRNHISLNSLGIPFAQLMEINNAISSALKDKVHEPAELYMEEQFLYSLNFRMGYDRNSLGKYQYHNKMTNSERNYICIGWEQLLDNLKSKSEKDQ